MPLLSHTQLSDSLTRLPGWEVKSNFIERLYSFPDFVAAMSFVNGVAKLAEQAQHHPDLDIRYNKVRVALSTHDAGGITERDIALAAEIDETIKA